MQLQLPQTREIRGIRVLTTQQIAQLYEVSKQVLSHNFNYNRHRFTEGKHFITLQGEDLRSFKASQENLDNLKYAHVAYLWTEKGALLHAKSVNTDRAWQAYEFLVDCYFRAEEQRKVPVTVETKKAPAIEPKPYTREVVDVPENPEVLKAIQKIRDDLTCMDVLLQYCIRYTEKKVYNKIQKAAAEVLPIIVQDWNKFFDTEPKIIQKAY